MAKKATKQRKTVGPIVKPQPTVRGYNAFVIQEVATAKGITLSEAAAWVVDQWVMVSRELLDEQFGITNKKWRMSTDQQQAEIERFKAGKK